MQTPWLAVFLFASPYLVSPAGQREPVQRVPAEQTAARILERMGKTYAECKTYRDTGVVTILFFKDDRKRTDRRPFTTAFVRPDEFRYEFRSRRGEEEFDRYLVWCKGQDVRTRWDIRPGVGTETSLPRALAGPTGVSGGSAYTVPALLMPQDTGWNLTDLEDAQRVEDGEIDGTKCYRIKGSISGRPMLLWIEKTSSLLRRIEQENQFPDFRTESTTDYQPEVDVPIPAELLTFDPPQEDKR